jgi:hypothetical protein
VNGIFHYYAVKLLALRGGFGETDAEIIAHSCQMVDRSLIPIRVDIEGGGEYTVEPTHHFGFWDKKQEDEVWIPFHFFPSGNPGGEHRNDRREDPLCVRPNAPPVKELLIEALKTRNPYRVGIAMHTYADSWAHQNFIGRNSGYNRIENFSPVPPVGHAQIGRNPDIWSLEWIDPRLVPEQRIVDNSVRFSQAAEKMYKYLATYHHRDFSDWELISWEVEDLTVGGKKDGENKYPRKNRIAEDHQLELDFRLALECEELDEGRWFDQALPQLPTGTFLRPGNTDRFVVAQHEIRKILQLAELPPRKAGRDFLDSDLYRWSEAAREHRECARRIIANI